MSGREPPLSPEAACWRHVSAMASMKLCTIRSCYDSAKHLLVMFFRGHAALLQRRRYVPDAVCATVNSKTERRVCRVRAVKVKTAHLDRATTAMAVTVTDAFRLCWPKLSVAWAPGQTS